MNVRRWPIASALVLAVALPAAAQDAEVAAAPTALVENTTLSSQWDYSLRPYFFLSGLSGSVTVAPVTVPVNSNFSDLLKHVKIGGFIGFTAIKNRWGVNADFQYINLYGESTRTRETSLDMKNIIGEIDLLFRPESAPTVRFLAGVRVYSLTQNVTLLGRDLPEASAVVTDPILGAHGFWALHDRWDFELRGDIGGFGVSSESTYQLLALFNWNINESFSIPFGYRVLGYQIETDEILMNTRMTGMVLGLDIRF